MIESIEWVSLKDEPHNLPDDASRVLITRRLSLPDFEYAYEVYEAFYFNKKFSQDNYIIKQESVVAWAYLPRPYYPEEKNIAIR